MCYNYKGGDIDNTWTNIWLGLIFFILLGALLAGIVAKTPEQPQETQHFCASKEHIITVDGDTFNAMEYTDCNIL